MAKETRQQIIENTRKKIASKYAEQVRTLKEHLQVTNNAYRNACNRVNQLEHEKGELEMKIKEQQDWIERLISLSICRPTNVNVNLLPCVSNKPTRRQRQDSSIHRCLRCTKNICNYYDK